MQRAGASAWERLFGKRAWWIVALVFLCNPNWHGVDLLPDFVGYALMLRALRRLGAADESFGEGCRLFRRLVYLSVARLIGVAWIVLGTGRDNRPVLLLTLCFALGVLELLAVFPACYQLFHGLSYLALRMGGQATLAPARGGSSTDVTDRASLNCRAFAVIKTALCVLPELASLADASYRQGLVVVDWYRYINLFRMAALLLGTLVGVWWLVGMVRYLGRIRQDETLWCALLDHCEQYERVHPERIPQRHLKQLFWLLVLSCVFCIQIYISSLHLLPSVLTPVLLLAALGVIRRYLPPATTVAAAACYGVHAVISGVSYALSTQFFLQYDIYALYRNEQVYTAYRRVLTASVIEAVALTLSVVATAMVLRELIRRYTGSHGAAARGLSKQDMLMLRRRRLRRRLLPVGVLGVLCGGAHVAYYYLLPRCDFVWMIDVAVSLLLVWLAWLRLHDVCDELDVERMAEQVA